MATYRLSRLAEADLSGIGTHTLQTLGLDQTIRYLDELEARRSNRLEGLPHFFPVTRSEAPPTDQRVLPCAPECSKPKQLPSPKSA